MHFRFQMLVVSSTWTVSSPHRRRDYSRLWASLLSVGRSINYLCGDCNSKGAFEKKQSNQVPTGAMSIPSCEPAFSALGDRSTTSAAIATRRCLRRRGDSIKSLQVPCLFQAVGQPSQRRSVDQSTTFEATATRKVPMKVPLKRGYPIRCKECGHRVHKREMQFRC